MRVLQGQRGAALAGRKRKNLHADCWSEIDRPQQKIHHSLNEVQNIETQQDLFYSVVISVPRTEFFLLFIFEFIKVSKARSAEPITSCNQ